MLAKAALDDLVWIAPGTFRMGSEAYYPEEGPVRSVSVRGFFIERDPSPTRPSRASCARPAM